MLQNVLRGYCYFDIKIQLQVVARSGTGFFCTLRFVMQA